MFTITRLKLQRSFAVKRTSCCSVLVTWLEKSTNMKRNKVTGNFGTDEKTLILSHQCIAGTEKRERNPATVYVTKYLRCLVALRTSLPLFETRQQVNKPNGATHFWMERWLVDRTQWGFDSLSAKDCFRDITWSADGLASHFPLERVLKALSFHYNKILWLVCFL